MAILTVGIRGARRRRLPALADRRNLGLNSPMEELSIGALARHDTEMRFRMRAAKGSPQRGLLLLDKLDRRHAQRLRTSRKQRDGEKSQ